MRTRIPKLDPVAVCVDLAALMRGHYEELKNKGKQGKRFGQTSMKPEAAKGTGNYFGMEPLDTMERKKECILYYIGPSVSGPSRQKS